MLSEARRAVAASDWVTARDAFAAADAPMEPNDLEAWGLAAVLTGHYAESETVRERAHYAYLAAGDVDGAARVAFWLALALITLCGEQARGGGWLARMSRVVADSEYTVWTGYELVARGMRAFFSGDPHTARALNAEGIAIADRHGDLDLRLLAGNGHAQSRLSTGELAEALAELDEMMVLATTAEVNPQAAGLVCCAVINACTECMDVHRTIEWTQALTRWCDRQRGLVPYRGQCTVHQVEMHQLRGRWDGALGDIRRVLDRVDEHPADNSAGMAHYRHGELLRVRGSYGPAEDSYREALRHGHDPQPGLALLRLAQGRTDAALTAIRRALDEDHYRKSARTQLLAAGVEIALAAGDAEFARSCAARFQEVATELDSPLLAAFDAVARGSIALAEDRPQPALAALREALAHWVQIDAPYEAARCRVLVAQAHRALGDQETADLELEVARSTFAKLCAPAEAVRLAAVQIAPGPQRRTAGPDGLTPRELEVLRLVATGASNRDIATTLFLSEKTVARHVANIFIKIDVSSRSAATAYAFAQRLA